MDSCCNSFEMLNYRQFVDFSEFRGPKNRRWQAFLFSIQVFQVMHHLGLGIEGATKAIIVANALKRVQKKRGHTRTSAIDYLSSCLTTAKLLGSVEKTTIVCTSPSTPLKLTDSSSSASATSATDESFSNSSQNSSVSSTASASLLKNTSTVRPSRRTLSKSNLKNLKRQSKPSKPVRKRKEDETIISQSDNDSNNVDAQVTEKELLVKEVQSRAASGLGHNCKSPSPNVVRHAGKRVASHSRDHDMNSIEEKGQPSKRQRLDSIWMHLSCVMQSKSIYQQECHVVKFLYLLGSETS